MYEPRPPISDAIQREVRQRCAFGCVLCGAPIYEYHHMVPYATQKEHTAANITLLCATHHNESTSGLLSPDQVAQANEEPYNRQRGVSSPYGLHYEGHAIECVIGGNTFSSQLRDNENATIAIPVSVDDTDLLWFRIDRSGGLFLNANIFDVNNLPILVVRENALAYRTNAWDVKFEGRTLAVREATRNILFEIEFVPPHRVNIYRARLLCNGIEILVRKSHIFIVNSGQLLVANRVADVAIGLQLGRNDRQLGGAFSSNPEALCRYHMLAKEVHRRERRARKDMEKTMVLLGIPFDLETP